MCLPVSVLIRVPYLLDFLGLKGAYSEKDLETAILRDLEAFLVELGSDFAFLARQKRITVDGEDFFLPGPAVLSSAVAPVGGD